MTGAGRTGIKQRLYEVLEVNRADDRLALLVDRLLVLLIIGNVAAVVLETVPELAMRYELVFTAVEVVTLACFVLEYGLRLWVADLHAPLRRLGPVRARLAFMRQPAAVVDLLAILPGVFTLAHGGEQVSVFVAFRLLRFLKLARYSTGIRSLVAAISAERRALAATAVIMGGFMIASATLMHAAEGALQPERFGSIPLAMYWSVTTLTTVGYGDMVPVTPLGRLIASVTMFFGYCMFALPVGIIATAFAREIHQRDFVVTWSMVARVPVFSDLSAAEVAEIMRLLRSQTARAGSVITYKGDEAHSMYFIVSGLVEISLPHETVRLSDGAFFGEIAILKKTRRSADALALVDTRLLVLDAADMQRLMHHKPDIGRHIHAVARERVTPRGDIAEQELELGVRAEEPRQP